MFGVKNTSNEILSMHTLEVDAEASKTRLDDETLVIVEDSEANLITAFVQEE